MKTKLLPGQGIIAHNQYGPSSQKYPLPNPILETPPCPRYIIGHARGYYFRNAKRLCESGILGANNWQLFVNLCSAWGDVEKWTELVLRMEEENPQLMGVVAIENGVVRISEMQRQKQRAEAHFDKLYANFFKLSAKVFGTPKADDDDGWGDD
jgi:hypothetical protein